jgi:hypothetical protein
MKTWIHQQRISLNESFLRCAIIRNRNKEIKQKLTLEIFEFYFYHTPEAATKFVVGRKERKLEKEREIRADFK